MSSRLNILMVDDDDNLCKYISSVLNCSHCTLTCATTVKTGLSLAASLCPDLILLELRLPDGNGRQFLRQLRSWSNVPVIIISSCTEVREKVKALDAGADDYLTKPLSIPELCARIRVALRHRSADFPAQAFSSCGLTVDFDSHSVTVKDVPVHLTRIEYNLLSLLAHHPGKVLSYSFMIGKIWGPYADSDNRILRVNMANIRRKLEENPAKPVYIFTENGVGYRMCEAGLTAPVKYLMQNVR